ncbi:MAG: helix-turn-helix domain-containing protein [Bacteroidales bacterium]|jgi:DNA-binding CsgD family transcriptional regulator|nr:helix-turn-helix domain-containing protein [Bacteroidales bacterium]
MTLNPITQRPWNIPQTLEKAYSKENIEELLYTLTTFSRGIFYMLDFHKQKVFVHNDSSLILCGHPKELADREGFDFFKRIIDPNLLKLAASRDMEFLSIVSSFPESQRKDFVLHYNSILKHADGRDLFCNHKATPFKLDKNGNIWLVLLTCAPSLNKVENKWASIIDKKSHHKYDYVGLRFIFSEEGVLSLEETKILKLSINGCQAKQICEILQISESTLKRRLQEIYAKLDVKNLSGAIHKAHLMGAFTAEQSL